MVRATFDQVISLGPDCLPAMQAQHYFSRDRFSGGLFNFQVTPLIALRAYFAQDFHGMLERDHLAYVDGTVCNTKFGTAHPHQFLNGLEHDYATARKRHDYLCTKMRRLLNAGRPLLVITHSPDVSAGRRDVGEILRTYNPRLDFELICVPDVVRDQKLWRSQVPIWKEAFDAVVHGASNGSRFGERMQAAIGRQLRRVGRHIKSGQF